MANYLERRTISINGILNVPISYGEAVRFLMEGFKKKWENDDFMIHEKIETYEVVIAERLRLSKYLTDKWNYRI
jgi:lipoate-protein ligase A